MPKTRMINPDEIEVFSATPVEEEPHEETAQEKKTNAFEESLNKTGDEGTISVHRQDNGGKEAMVFIKSCPADQYTLESLLTYIQTNHPSGQYRIMLRINGRIKGNQLYTIESPILLNDTPQGGSSDLQTVANLLRESMNQRHQPQESESMQLQKMLLYKELFAQPTAPAVDPMVMLTGMMGAMVQMKQMMGEPEKEEKEDGTTRTMELLGTLVSSAMTKVPDVQSAPATHNKTPEEMENEKMFNQLKNGVTKLVKGAKSKADPAIFADLIIDNVSPHTVKTFFAHQDSLEKLIQQFPIIGDHRAWFDDLIEHVKAIQGDESSKFWSEYQDDAPETDDKIIDGELNASEK